MPFPISGVLTSSQYDKLNAISNDDENSKRLATRALDKDSFLKLMMAQLQHQDPLEPMDNSQTIAQMAQFSSVEQLSNISAAMSASNSYNDAIATQLLKLTTLVEQLIPSSDDDASDDAGTDAPDETGDTTDTEDKTDTTETTESTATKAKMIEQNETIVNELIKLNNAFSSYFEKTDNSTSEDMLGSLGQ